MGGAVTWQGKLITFLVFLSAVSAWFYVYGWLSARP